MPAVVLGRRTEDGTPIVRMVPADETLSPVTPQPIMSEAQMLRDLHRIDSRRAAAQEAVSVPGQRLVTDPATLDLIGQGLPIIRGVRQLPCMGNHWGMVQGQEQHGTSRSRV